VGRLRALILKKNRYLVCGIHLIDQTGIYLFVMLDHCCFGGSLKELIHGVKIL
jgi:hypothetical protein